MPKTIDEALKHKEVTVFRRNDSMGLFEIKIGDLSTVIEIDLIRFLNSEWTEFRVSHSIKTPLQAGPYRTSIPFADCPGGALHKAISGLIDWYRWAIEKGHVPDDSWLVKN